MKNREAKLAVEHSKTYIGYKLLWVITLFIEGKKFPSGSLSAFKWRCYIYDIVRFLTNDKFMAWFLDFDPHAYFNVLQKLYLEPEPYEYIKSQQNFFKMYEDSIQGLEPCLSHEAVVVTLDEQVDKMLKQDKESNDGEMTVKGEALSNAFMFFVTQISRRNKVALSEELCLRIISEQIAFHKKLLKLPKEELK